MQTLQLLPFEKLAISHSTWKFSILYISYFLHLFKFFLPYESTVILLNTGKIGHYNEKLVKIGFRTTKNNQINLSMYYKKMCEITKISGHNQKSHPFAGSLVAQKFRNALLTNYLL